MKSVDEMTKKSDEFEGPSWLGFTLPRFLSLTA
jgi:hypothetical protein